MEKKKDDYKLFEEFVDTIEDVSESIMDFKDQLQPVIDIASKGLQYNATFEKYETAFELLTGSAQKASETMEYLKDTAINTPFDIPQLAETTQTLMNYGFTVDEAIGKLSMLGDLSMGNADSLAAISEVFGQMNATGQVTSEMIETLVSAGFNPLQEISAYSGETVQSLYEKLDNGNLSVDLLTESLTRATSEGGMFFESMATNSETFEGQLATLKEAFGQFLGDKFLWLNDLLANTVMPTITELLLNMEKYEPLLVILTSLLGGLGVAFITNKMGITDLMDIGTVFKIMLQGVGKAIGVVTSAFSFLFNPLTFAIVSISALIGLGVLLIKNWKDIGPTLKASWESIKEAVAKLYEDMCSFVKGLTSKLTSWIPFFGEKETTVVKGQKLAQLHNGTDYWAGGFAYMNEGGRGELTYLPNGSQVIPHDLSVKYVKESAKANASYTTEFDMSSLGEYIVQAIGVQGEHLARGISNIRMVANNRETARFMSDLGFSRR